METSDIKSFYDQFLESKMLEYRVRGNKRIDRAVQRIRQYVDPESHILDIGCGIGIVAEQLAKHLNPIFRTPSSGVNEFKELPVYCTQH